MHLGRRDRHRNRRHWGAQLSDLRLVWNEATGSADLAVANNDLESDDTFETAVLLSLFTNARAKPGDVLPAELGTRRGGWWANELSPIDGDNFGSRLWLLARSKQNGELLTRAQEYASEALDWMLEDAVASKVTVVTSFTTQGWLLLVVTIERPKQQPTAYKYDYNWRAQEARRAA